ncbi:MULTISPECIES: non-homologous end-joining DNA ligase LigD [unclassified Streptomyces]|uniref:non-homologous end-joining DNA ligase LigD n=1 Tax=unclassified Streptomyces TaxID=2593676 RepID=UPI002E2C379A|nr:hypothetical protein [Streptomyces sp. NBC_00223]
MEDVRGFAREGAGTLADRRPRELSTEPRKGDRADRPCLDVLRNGCAWTAVAPYAVRARRPRGCAGRPGRAGRPRADRPPLDEHRRGRAEGPAAGRQPGPGPVRACAARLRQPAD